jgi:hypothetical protein
VGFSHRRRLVPPVGASSNKETPMPLNDKGKKILSSMKKEYGADKGERVFYASQNKGTVKGTEKKGKK